MPDIIAGRNDLPMIVLKTPSGMYTADVYLHGAHCTAWTKREEKGEKNLLFLSDKAKFDPPSAIRGGIPICWPQFSDLGPIKSQHGFARNTEFALIEHQGNFVRLRLSQSEIENKIREDFPYSFVLEMDMRLEDDQLTQTMRVMNTCMEDQDNEKARLQFTAALHTYFSLEEGIESAVVEGLQGTTYLDSLDGRSQQTEREECIRFTGEVDRIYCNTPETIRIRDGSSRCFRIQKTSTFPDAVVWNPAVEKSAKMADFGDEEWKNMVCIEVAHAGSGIVEIGPGEVWEASQSLYLES